MATPHNTFSETLEQMATTAAPIVTKSGVWTGLAGFVMSSHFVGLLGVLIAAAGFGVTTYYKHKEDRRREVEHLRRMKKLETAPSPLEGDHHEAR